MKLRIKNNSIRLRLTQGEVSQFNETGMVEEIVEFGLLAGEGIRYRLLAGDGPSTDATFHDGKITVIIPKGEARRWGTTDEVSLETTKTIATGKTLKILVEKDFACLQPRSGDEDVDTFPNPIASEVGLKNI